MKPSPTHPWSYQMRHKTSSSDSPSVVSRRPLQLFLSDITTNWTSITVPVRYRGKFEEYLLLELPDTVVATWLLKALSRYTSSSVEREDDFTEEIE